MRCKIAGIHHHIHCVKCRQIWAIQPEKIAKDVFPDRMPNSSSCLIGQGSMCVKPGFRIPNHKSRKGIERFSSAAIPWQVSALHLVTKLLVADTNYWRRSRRVSREPSLDRAIHGRCIINIHGQFLTTRLSFSFCVGFFWRKRDTLHTFFPSRGWHAEDVPGTPAKDYSVLSGQPAPLRATAPCWQTGAKIKMRQHAQAHACKITQRSNKMYQGDSAPKSSTKPVITHWKQVATWNPTAEDENE